MNFRTNLVLCLGSACFALLFSGCLTADHKEVRLTLNEDGKSGTGVIIFSNITSSPGDTTDVSKDDFNTLIAEYYQGRKIELENKGMHDVRKKLYKDGDKLMGEIDFEFDDLSSLGILRYKNSGPYMYYTVADGFFTSGQYELSNGSYMGEKMPVIFWDADQRELDYKMSLSTPQEIHKPLVAYYDSWKSGQR